MNDAELIQSFCRRFVNSKVREHFKDIDRVSPEGDRTNLGNSRVVARQVCYHKDNDPITVTVARLILFNLVVGDIFDKNPMYSIPITTFDESVEYKPQVILHFEESLQDAAKNNRRPIEARVGYRIMDNNLTLSEARQLAKKIKSSFAVPSKFKFKKGKTKFSYRDKSNGYQFIIAAFNESEARRLITKVLSLNGHSYNEEFLTDSESRQNWNSNQKRNILGRSYDSPKKRPIGDVVFSYAELKIHGLPKPKILVDTSGRFGNAFEIAY